MTVVSMARSTGARRRGNAAVADEAMVRPPILPSLLLGCRAAGQPSARARSRRRAGRPRGRLHQEPCVSSATARLLVPGMLQTAAPRARAARCRSCSRRRRSSGSGGSFGARAIAPPTPAPARARGPRPRAGPSASAASSPGCRGPDLDSASGELPQPARQGRSRLILTHDMAHPTTRAFGLATEQELQLLRRMGRRVPNDILAVLRRAGLLDFGDEPEGEPLTGGVSSDIWRVDLPRGPVCVKRALAQAAGRGRLARADRAQPLRGALDARSPARIVPGCGAGAARSRTGRPARS